MSMGMRLSMGQSMQQRMALTLEQQMTMQQKLQQKIVESMRMLLEATGDDPADLYDAVLTKIIPHIAHDQARHHAPIALGENGIKSILLRHPYFVESSNPHHLQAAIVQWIYDKEGGIPIEGDGGPGSLPTILRTTKGDIAMAISNPERLHKEGIDLQSTNAGGNVTARMEQVTEKVNALGIVEMLRPQTTNIRIIARAAIQARDEEGQPLFRDFLRDLVMLDRLQYLVSDRIQNRFADRFIKTSKKDTEGALAVPFLNSVSEFLLVSMGVIRPELMMLRKGEVDENEYMDLKQQMNGMGIDLDTLMAQYKLQTQGSFYFHRWAVEGQRPTAVTDEMVRNFMIQEVDTRKGIILEGMNFPSVFEKVQGLRAEYTNSTKVDERATYQLKLRELLVETLTDDDAQTFLTQLIREQLFPAFIRFMDMAGETAKRAG